MAREQNIVGPMVRKMRQQRGWSHHQLAVELATRGVFIRESSLKQIESQDEFVTTVEMVAFATVFNVSISDLIPKDISISKIAQTHYPHPPIVRSISEGCSADGFGPN